MPRGFTFDQRSPGKEGTSPLIECVCAFMGGSWPGSGPPAAYPQRIEIEYSSNTSFAKCFQMFRGRSAGGPQKVCYFAIKPHFSDNVPYYVHPGQRGQGDL